MSDFQTRKRELLLESDLNRKVLQVEFGQWELRAVRWQTRLGRAHVLWRVVNPLAQAFLARKTGSLFRSLWSSFTRRFQGL
jgi:hypothetical protein